MFLMGWVEIDEGVVQDRIISESGSMKRQKTTSKVQRHVGERLIVGRKCCRVGCTV